MRRNVSAEKLRDFMRELGLCVQSPGAVYLTGGATALLLGLREQTIDIHLKLDPEPRGVFEGLANLKNRIELNVELASPADFIAVAPDWKAKSVFIAQHGKVAFYHFDLAAQVLSKIERGYKQDLEDARSFLDKGGISSEGLWSYFHSVEPDLLRYPAIDRGAFKEKLKSFLQK